MSDQIYSVTDVPFVDRNDDGTYNVKVKEARGQYWILSEPTLSKRLANRDLQRIRRKMCEAYAEVDQLRRELRERHDVLKAQLRPEVELEIKRAYGFGEGGRGH